MNTVASCLRQAEAQLFQAGIRDAAVDARWLLCHVLQRNEAWLRTWPEASIDSVQQQQFQKLLERRERGEPIAYLTGRQGFWTLDLEVTPDTLVPRPDTELLVEAALERFGQEPINVLDLGTGTGAIALALKSERPSWHIVASDVDKPSLELTRRNAQMNGLNIHCLQSSWFSNIPPQPFHLIVSNPPYIESDDPHLQGEGVRFEPLRALVSGADGLDAIREITHRAPDYLVSGGCLMLEHGYLQAEAVRNILQVNGFQSVATLKDLADNERITLGCLLKED